MVKFINLRNGKKTAIAAHIFLPGSCCSVFTFAFHYDISK